MTSCSNLGPDISSMDLEKEWAYDSDDDDSHRAKDAVKENNVERFLHEVIAVEHKIDEGEKEGPIHTDQKKADSQNDEADQG